MGSSTVGIGAGDVQVVELSVAINSVPMKWKKIKINLEEVARLRWIEKMKLAAICHALRKSRSTVQVSIRTLRNSIISQMNFTESEKNLIESAIFEEIKKYGSKIHE